MHHPSTTLFLLFISLGAAAALVQVDRRRAIIISLLFGGSSAAVASDRPYAPVSALVPVTQQRLLLQRALASVQQQLPDLEKIKNDYFDPPSETIARRAAISMTRRYQNDQQILLSQMSQSQPRLSGKTFRAACNVYTANLRFGESYTLTASPAEKSRLIRTYDKLPDVKQVITADLDLRDLYRNKVQTLIEDAQAEVYNNKDIDELTSILVEANKVLDQWFGLIANSDVQEAEKLVLEQQTTTSSSGSTIIELPKQQFNGLNFFS